MDTKLKYVRIKQYGDIIIFPCVIEHSTFKHLEPISAGFCYVDVNKVTCFGESFSLGIASNPKEDSQKATWQLFGYDAMLNLMKEQS